MSIIDRPLVAFDRFSYQKNKHNSMGFFHYLKFKWIDIIDKNNKLCENREILIKTIRILNYFLNFIFLLFILEINFFLTLIYCYIFNKILWDIVATWYIGDFINGKLIYIESKYIRKKNYIVLITIIDFIYDVIYDIKLKINDIKIIEKFNLSNKKKKNLKEKINNIIFIFIRILWYLWFNIKYVLNFINYLYLILLRYLYIYNKINYNNKLSKSWIRLNTKKLISKYILNFNKSIEIKKTLYVNNIKINYLEILSFLIINEKKNEKIFEEYKSISIYFKFLKNFKILFILIFKIIKKDVFLLIKWLYLLKLTYFYIKSILEIKLNLILYNIYNNNYINKYIYILTYNTKLKYNNLIKYKNNNIYLYNNNYSKYNNKLKINISKIIKNFKININYNNIYIYKLKNLYNYIININWKEIILELKILYINSKRPFKQLKYDKSLYIIKILDGLEYAMLTNKKSYKNKNIIKYHKKKYKFKKIPSKIEKYINTIKPIIKKNIIEILEKIKIKINNYKEVISLININKKNKITYINLDIYSLIKINLYIIFKNIIPSHLNIILIKLNNPMLLIKSIQYYNIIINKLILNEHIYIINIYKINLIKDIKIKKYSLNYIFKEIKIQTNKITKYININEKIITKLILWPILILNFILSDICLSISFLKKKNKKKIKKINSKINKNLLKLNLKFKKYIKYIYINVIKLLKLIFCKTIYITFIVAYPLNYFFINEFNKYYIIFLKNIENYFILNYLIINKNILLTIITIFGLTLTIKWSRGVHKIYGNYLWTMTIFPLFLESHKILYLKLNIISISNLNYIENIIITKLNLWNLLNYKIQNIYNIFSYTIIIFFLIYCIKHEAFRSVYANLKATRWKFIKYPLLIILIEILKPYLIQYISVFILYLIIKYEIILNLLNSYIIIYNINIIKLLYIIINQYIIELPKIPYEKLILVSIPNIYLINIILDIILFFISGKWLILYLRTYVKKDKKYVAFPLVTSEIILKYIIYTYFIYYSFFLLYSIATNPNGIIFEYIAIALVFTYLYLEIRVHKIPKKSMAWYFRQIVQLWPSTWFTIWTFPKYLYYDQQKYLLMRLKFKRHRKDIDEYYKKTELWEKRIIWLFQRDKEDCLHLFSTFCKLMQRKESMLKEFNIFDYVGWHIDWTYNYKRIHLFRWKLNFWDKPYTYLFKKYMNYINVGEYFFFIHKFLYRYSTRVNYLTMHFFVYKLIDYYYSLRYIILADDDDTIYSYMDSDEFELYEFKYKWYHLIFNGWKIKKIAYKWKKNLNNKNTHKIRLQQLKKLKLILMDFSSGKKQKPADWIFPYYFEKEYKMNGWKMFENQEIDLVPLDWKPSFKEW